jgi:hypothetical protein
MNETVEKSKSDIEGDHAERRVTRPKPAPAPAPPVLEDLPPIPQNVFGLKESHNPGYWVCLPYGYKVEHLKKAQMWANIAGSGTLRPYSTVEVFTADHSEWALVYVFQCGRNWASTQILQHVKLGAQDVPTQHVKFIIVDRGPVDRFCLVNATTNEIVKSGFASDFDAMRFKAEHERKII